MIEATQKVEIEIEHHVLTQTKKLSDGTFEKIFSRNPRNEVGLFTYNCHLCAVANLSGERSLQTHITGKKHQQRLIYDYVPDAQQFKRELVPKSKPATMNIYPGEPAPPGSEEEFRSNVESVIECISNKQTKAIIGMEYVIEVVDNKAREPFFVCTLCEKKCDPRNIIPQLTSHRHRMKYLEFHFPSVMSVLNRNHKFNMNMNFREEILADIAMKIERKFKRLKPFICDYREYEGKKFQLTEKIKQKKHFEASDWQECEKVLLENLFTDKELESVSSESESEFKDRDSKALSSNRIKNFSSKNLRESKTFNQFISTFTGGDQKTGEKRKILTPRELSEQSNAKMHEKYIIEKYKATVSIKKEELERRFKEYSSSPESHPKYSEEWKTFWSRRYKELLSQGKNGNDYDYKPEWIEFWTKRMKDLLKIDIDKMKEKVRKDLKLTINAISDIEFSPKLTRKRSISQSPIRESRGRKRRDSFIEISSDESIEDQHYNYKDSKGKNHCSDYKKSSKERSRSRFSESPYSRHLDYRSKEKYDHHLMRYRNSERSPTPNSAEIEEDGPVNLVSVCRLLSALETELGLLAKPVIDLLKKGVALEKSKPNSADELLFNTENSNILETVKEKLKGVLTANLLASNKIVAVKRAIQNIATLLHDVNSKKKHENENKSSLNEENSDPVALAKLEIAKVITQSLLDQGRSDFPPEELEALVESFIESTKNDEQQKANKIENVKTKDSIETLKTPLVVTTDTKKSSENSTGLENLTDEDLQTLLRNFADLTSDEQTHLIAYLSKIEQSNPARVEKLRKFVNIGDVDEYNDFEENVTKMKSDRELDTSFNETSMELVKNDLSDDDYDDEIMAKHLGKSDDLNKKPSMSSSAVSSNAFKDNLGLADSLMSSLIQSSMPLSMNNELELQGNEWGGACVSGASAYYQQPQLKNYQNLMSRNFSVYPNVLIPQNEMSIQVITPQMESSWPQQSSVSNFTYEQNHSHDYPNKNNRDNVQYRKKFENHNNHQLTGKKSRR